MLTAQEYGSKRQAVLAGSCAQEYGSCRFAAQEYGSGKVAAQEYGSSKVAAQEYGSQAPEAEPVTIASVRTTKWQALYVERGGTGVLCAATLYVCTSPAAKKKQYGRPARLVARQRAEYGSIKVDAQEYCS